ncbi:gfo/Idh/MocA family oxidoreductase [Burkholderia sp. Bp9143]|uniref:Gfo/Idh/MocA family oxidoreductase n=1 Tax=Burkholderia sp. Bp9143 TaxID=2184574 RepID=UPI000F5B5D54|nr:Gfo/Idh/MocA family oxidoreductase [Burkholderia sp. Bp9143]RQR31426.1 gfo/Idh/MocA family oxidoreductase [Burkholderia sp. Bp9143]
MTADNDKSVRIAVAGAGLIGQEHIKRVLATPGARLAAIVDPAPKAKEQANSLQVAWYPDLEVMLATDKPDGVVVGLPNPLHFQTGMQLVRHGVTMLMEKPVCDSVAEAIRFADAAEQANIPVLVGHHRRHSPLTQRAKAIIDSGRLGRITAVQGFCWFLKPRDYFEGKTAWRGQPGAGVLLLNLIHVIDDLRNLCGDIESVQAAASNAARGFPVEDTVGIILRYRNGAIGTLAISDAAAAPWNWEMTAGENRAFPRTDEACYFIAGMEGSLSVPRLELWSHGTDLSWWSPLRSERAAVPEQDPFTLQSTSDPLSNQMQHFCEVIRGTTKPLLDARGAARTLAATLAVKEAAATGQVVTLS